MIKSYKTSAASRIFLLVILLFGIREMHYYLIENLYTKTTMLALLCIGGFYYFLKHCSEYIKIENEKIIEVYKYPFFPTRTNELRYDEITEIQFDYWPPRFLNLFVFHLIPKRNANKPFKRFIISGGIANRRELLSEILSRIGPDVIVEDEVYKYVQWKRGRTI